MLLDTINRLCGYLATGMHDKDLEDVDLRALHKCILRNDLCRRWIFFELSYDPFSMKRFRKQHKVVSPPERAARQAAGSPRSSQGAEALMGRAGVTTVESYLNPEADWSFRAMAGFPEEAPPLPGLGYWDEGALWPWPCDKLLRVSYWP